MLRISRAGWAVLFLVAFLVIVNLALLFSVFWLASLDRQGIYRDQIRNDLGIAITNIVDRIIQDVGLMKARYDEASSVSGDDESSKSRFIEAEISTMGSSVWLNGRRFELGSFVSPYGVIAEVGADVAVVVDLDGSRRIIARPVPPLPAVPSSKSASPSKKTDAKTATAASGASASVADA